MSEQYPAQPAPPAPFAPATPPAGPKKGFAVTALVLGIVAILGSWIPFVSIGSAVIAIAGLVFGIIAIVKALNGTAGGKVMAIVGTALSALAIILAIVSTALGASAIDTAIDDAIEEVESDYAAEVPGTDPTTGSTDADSTDAEEPVTDAVDPIVVVDKQTWVDSSGYWKYYLLLENPSTEAFYYGFEEVTVEMLDADGTILASETSYPTLAPGTELGITGIFFDSETIDAAEVDRIEVYLPEEPTSLVSEGEVGTMTTSGVEATSDTYSVTVSGTVESTFAEDQETVVVTVVAFDAEGTVVAESSTFVDRLPSGGASRFEVGLYDIDSTDGLTFQAWASPLF